MYGLEAISVAHGWAIALAGAIIVLSGLTILCFVISQLHRVVEFLDRGKKTPQNNGAENEEGLTIPDHFPSDIKEAARLYDPLIEQIVEPFRLSELYEISQNKGFPHPHLTITRFREAKVLVPQGDGVFIWNQ